MNHCRSPRRLAVFCAALSLLAWNAFAQAPATEYRGFWIDAFGPGYKTASEVTTMINNIRDAKANMIVPEVRKRGDAYYSGSIYEPKASDISASFDPLQDMLTRAHDTSGGKQRIEVHAWIVSYKIWGSQSATPPASNPPHPYIAHPDWLTQDNTGATWDGSAYAFDPGHPDVQRYTYNVCMDIISRYDIDGFNFDYIRYTGPTWGYHPVTVQRFNTRFGRSGLPAPDDALWKQFRRDQVTALVRKVYLNAIALKPNIKISADTITWGTSGVANLSQWWGSSAYSSVLQDWRAWMEEGILDLNIPMNYYREHLHASAYLNWMNFAKDQQHNRHAIIGPGIYLNYTSNSISQMRATRNPSPAGNYARGVCGYVYKQPDNQGTSFNTFKSYLTTSPNEADPLSPPIFENTVPIPPMPWKTSPTKGHLKGFISTLNTNLDGAVVTVTGPVTRSQTNDATGFYGFVDLPPGAYTITATFPGYVAGNTNITITAGVVGTRDLTLGISGPPAIISHPQNATAYAGANANFAVSASGVEPITYQWRHAGTNLPGATSSALQLTAVTTNQAGPYTAVVSNPYGAVTSSAATLTVNVPAPNARLIPKWNLAPNSRPYLTTGTTERGLAYNPASHRLLLASRAGGTAVYALDPDTGDDLHPLNMGSGLITGGTFPINLVATANDGAVFVCNLVTDSAASNLRIYRWANDNPATTPTLAYSGNPFTVSQRLGDTLDARGSGNGTQLLLGTRNGTEAIIFTTSNGNTFTPHIINVPDVPAGAFGLGLAFGPGNTFWGKSSSQPLRKVAFDLPSGLGSVLQANGSPAVSDTVAPIAYTTTLNVVAGVSISSALWDSLQLFDLPGTSAVLVETNGFPTDNFNSNGTGAADFSTNHVFALNTGNGILAIEVRPPVIAPAITTPPQNLTILEGDDAPFTVAATGTAPLAYQWRFNSVPIPGATVSAYTRLNAQLADAGNYTVLVSNPAGSVTSAPASLTVQAPPDITTQPQDLTLLVGQNGALTVAATGTAPIAYQWRKDGTNLPGATQTSLSFTPAQLADAGQYSVLLSNIAGTVASTEVQVTVYAPPVITQQPQPITAKAWSDIEFAVAATATPPPTYQWQHNGTDIPGATASNLPLVDIQPANAGEYSVLVSNPASTLASDPATLTVHPIAPPQFTNILHQPQGTQLSGIADPGTVALDHSTNLTHWLPGPTLLTTNGTFHWQDPDPATNKFYRARWLP